VALGGCVERCGNCFHITGRTSKDCPTVGQSPPSSTRQAIRRLYTYGCTYNRTCHFLTVFANSAFRPRSAFDTVKHGVFSVFASGWQAAQSLNVYQRDYHLVDNFYHRLKAMRMASLHAGDKSKMPDSRLPRCHAISSLSGPPSPNANTANRHST